MSDIKIQPSATGSATVTLTAPTTGTARTVTLPDSTDTLAVNSDVTNKLPLAGGTMTGTIANFTSTGIDDNADATAITIDSSENVGIGTTSPSAPLEINVTSGNEEKTALILDNPHGVAGTGVSIDFETGGQEVGRITGYHQQNDAGGLQFDTAGSPSTLTERMRIDSSGNVGIGVTPDRRLKVKGAASSNVVMFEHNDANGTIMDCRYDATSTPTNGAIFIRFGDASSNNGSITSTGSGTTVAYNTSSDYRLKENVDYTWDATTRLKQLKPARFNFIANSGTTVDGFLAHEVSSIVPEAVTGEKDAIDDDGNIDAQGIDQSKLVPLLVKTIQELEARITTLEG